MRSIITAVLCLSSSMFRNAVVLRRTAAEPPDPLPASPAEADGEAGTAGQVVVVGLIALPVAADTLPGEHAVVTVTISARSIVGAIPGNVRLTVPFPLSVVYTP
ncbi:hypothetical protein [Allokutzneria albata]|uniref:hypothetical protein n=1 Tax=Allokutzneria albata TaxID=211114 RepID=UPI001E409E99|nr:hypothetical protein [Allokutzneria albata]